MDSGDFSYQPLFKGKIIHKAFEGMAFWWNLKEYFQNDFQWWTILLTVEITAIDFRWRHFGDVPCDAFPSVPIQFFHWAIEAFAVFVPNTQAE